MPFIKRAIVVAVFAAMVPALSPGEARADPVCGPANAVAAGNRFCDRFKPTWTDILIGALAPGYPISKAVIYAECKRIVNQGYLIDLVVGPCCKAHDACYTRGGDPWCKDRCDNDMRSCNVDRLKWIPFGPSLGLFIAEAAAQGGRFTYNYRYGDYRCGL